MIDHYFFTTDVSETHVVLHDEEARHCTKVYRSKLQDTIYVMDGKGHLYNSVITGIDRSSVQARIAEKRTMPKTRPYRIHVAAALIKNMSRWEIFLEKAVEIGVDIITPIISKRTLKPSAKVSRLEHIITSACKQSAQFYRPELRPLMSYDDFISNPLSTDQMGLIGHIQSASRPWIGSYDLPEDITLLIGPEGDFTREEVDVALATGWQEISLGEQRLRTETAGIMAVSHIYSHFMNKNI